MARLVVNPASSRRPRELPLPRSPLAIGRDPSNDLVLPDAMVSRRHAVIEFRDENWVLRDCNSSNGSLVNGDRVQERGLRDGDLVAIGGARLLFREDVPRDTQGKVVIHPSARIRCADCGNPVRLGDAFCRDCGAKAQAAPIQPRMVCPDCNAVVALPARFCDSCGREFVAASETAIPGRLPALPIGVFRVPSDPAANAALPAASVAARAAAAAFDWGVVGGVQGLLLAPVAHYWLTRPAAQSVEEIHFVPILVSLALVPLCLVIGALYFVHFWGVRGATPGQRLLGLQVVGEDGRLPIGVPAACVRLLGYGLALAPLGAGLLVALWGRRPWHDLLAATRVVARERR